jgi:hypothetical protein
VRASRLTECPYGLFVSCCVAKTERERERVGVRLEVQAKLGDKQAMQATSRSHHRCGTLISCPAQYAMRHVCPLPFSDMAPPSLPHTRTPLLQCCCCCCCCCVRADFARTNNINGIITGLWPSVAQAIKEDFVMTMVSPCVCWGGGGVSQPLTVREGGLGGALWG